MDSDNDERLRLERRLCASDALSVDALRGIIDSYPPTQNVAYHSPSPCFHMACMNKNVTLEIIEYLFDVYPNAAGIRTTYFCTYRENAVYPLHLCCYNENCPSSVIKIVYEKYPVAIFEFSLVKSGLECGIDHFIEGLPIHYYLSRSSNVDIDTVKMLVQAYPDSLITGDDEMGCYPIHALLCNINVSNLLDILAYLIESEPISIRIADAWRRRALHIAWGARELRWKFSS